MSMADDAHRLLEDADRADWLSIRDIAHRIGVSPWQVRKWIENGQFDEIAVFSRKLTRVSRGAYDRFVDRNRQRTA